MVNVIMGWTKAQFDEPAWAHERNPDPTAIHYVTRSLGSSFAVESGTCLWILL